MRSWPIRIKLLAIPPIAAALMAGLIFVLAGAPQGGSPDHRGAIALATIAAFLALTGATWAIGVRLARGIDELGEVFAQLQDGEVPAPGGDAIEQLSASLRRAVSRGKERETRTRRSADLLKCAQVASGFGIFELDLDIAQLTGTPVFFELHRHGIAESYGLAPRVARHHASRGLRGSGVRELNAAVEAGGKFHAEYRTSAARWRRALAVGPRRSAIRIRRPARALIGTVTDITERKRLEATLRHTTESLNIAQTAAGVATMDLNLGTAAAGSARTTSIELLGIPPEHSSRRIRRRA